MDEIIKKYYLDNGITEELINIKMLKLNRHIDIKKEFFNWISTKQYLNSNCVKIENYTAKILSEKSKKLTGESAYLMLIMLREDKNSALKIIDAGCKNK